MEIKELTVRVYGLLLDEQQRLLVSDEIIQGKYYTKLPGGGLDLGEGLKDCLAREFQEEAGVDVQVGDHIYTTDYFQPSGFKPGQQFIGIYYWVKCADTDKILTHLHKHEFSESQKVTLTECESFRWIPFAEVTVDDFDLPTDKIAIMTAQSIWSERG